jgi:hypothetical protein
MSNKIDLNVIKWYIICAVVQLVHSRVAVKEIENSNEFE